MVRDAHLMTGAPEGNQDVLVTGHVSQPSQTETDNPGLSRVIEELDVAVEEYANRAWDMGETVKCFNAILESVVQFDEDQQCSLRLRYLKRIEEVIQVHTQATDRGRVEGPTDIPREPQEADPRTNEPMGPLSDGAAGAADHEGSGGIQQGL